MGRAKPGKRPRRTAPARKDRLSVAELKTQVSHVLRTLERGTKQIVLTEKGKPIAVLVAHAEFERLREYDRFVDAVREGIEDSESERVIEDEELDREIEAELGQFQTS